jgi:hypothetical protein
MQRSVPEWAIRQGWGRRPVRQEEGQGIPFAALGRLASPSGLRRPPEQGCIAVQEQPVRLAERAGFRKRSQMTFPKGGRIMPSR